MDKPQLSKQAFWDVDMDKIDYEKHAAYVVEKVIERGKAQDFKNLVNYYGFEQVGKLVLKASWLSDKSINFAVSCSKLNQLILNVMRRNC